MVMRTYSLGTGTQKQQLRRLVVHRECVDSQTFTTACLRQAKEGEVFSSTRTFEYILKTPHLSEISVHIYDKTT